MNQEKKILVRSMEELNKIIEQTLSRDAGITGKAQKFNSFNTPLLRSLLFGIIGFGLAFFVTILMRKFTSINVLLVFSSLSLVLSTLGVILSLYQSKGGNTAVKYDIALQEIEEEIDRQKNEIENLTKMNAPKNIIANRWNHLERLEKQRVAIVGAKSKIYYKRLYKNDSRLFENEFSRIKNEQEEEDILELAPKEKIILKAENNNDRNTKQ